MLKLIKWIEDSSLKSAGLYTAVDPIINFLESNDNYEVYLVCKNKAKSNEHWSTNSILSFYEFFIKTPLIYKGIHHCHGLWGSHSFISIFVAILFRQPIIISPHGMLDKWALSKSRAKKKVAIKVYKLLFFCKKIVFHALTEQERIDIVEIFGDKIQIVVIPNGVDIPKRVSPKNMYEKVQVLFLARLHEKKGIDLLLEAWRLFSKKKDLESNIYLTVAGWGDKLIEEQLYNYEENNFKYVGSVFGNEKEKLFNESHYLILPSFSEGLPMSILESWSYGLPTIMTEFCNLPLGFSSNCAIFIEPNTNSMLSALESIEKMDSDMYTKMSHNAISLVKSKYSWESICMSHNKNYLSLYNGS